MTVSCSGNFQLIEEKKYLLLLPFCTFLTVQHVKCKVKNEENNCKNISAIEIDDRNVKNNELLDYPENTALHCRPFWGLLRKLLSHTKVLFKDVENLHRKMSVHPKASLNPNMHRRNIKR